MQTIYKHRNKILVAITILMLIPFVFNIGLEPDEPFTMGLIRHSYGSIASLTAMDVHPPLYYWVLKTFLFIATFWTNSIFVKIIFARLLSLLFSLVTLYYLIKILNVLRLKYSNYIVSFIFFISPGVYEQEGIASKIRMYSLGTMLCIICLYYLLLFKKDNKLQYLLFICLSATLTLYTQYLIGMMAGLYILLTLIILFFNKKYKSFIQLLFTSILSVMLYIPWIPKIFMQFSAQSIGKHVNVLSSANIKYIIIRYVLIVFFSLIIIFSKKIKLSNDVKIILFANILLILLILLVNAKFNPNSISVRYMSIALIMNYVITGCVLFYNCNKKWPFKILVSIFLLILFSMDMHNINYQKNSMIVPSIYFYKEFNLIKKEKINTINSEKYALNRYLWDLHGGNYIYFSSIDKKIHYVKPLDVYDSIGNGNEKLFKKVYPGIDNYNNNLR